MGQTPNNKHTQTKRQKRFREIIQVCRIFFAQSLSIMPPMQTLRRLLSTTTVFCISVFRH